jgi:FkbM family methyltransferase
MKEKDFILSCFSQTPKGMYADIGAYDGVSNSTTRALQKLGWEGVCIEANPNVFDTLLKNRADGNTACYDVACVGSDAIESVKFTVFDAIPQFSGVSPSAKKTTPQLRAKGATAPPKIISVKAMTLDSILVNYFDGQLGNVDFISIDTEGTEKDVIAGIDLNRWQPRLICIENYDPRNADLDSFMRGRGYKVAQVIGINTFYEKA